MNIDFRFCTSTKSTDFVYLMQDRENIDLLQEMYDHQYKHVPRVVSILLTIHTTYLYTHKNMRNDMTFLHSIPVLINTPTYTFL